MIMPRPLEGGRREMSTKSRDLKQLSRLLELQEFQRQEGLWVGGSYRGINNPRGHQSRLKAKKKHKKQVERQNRQNRKKRK
jgi:hypothetical protein